MIDTTYWFMFPIATVVATIAMTFGIGGAVMFAPLFFYLGIPPNIALGTGLFLELFGFGSGLYGFTRDKLVNTVVGKHLLQYALPSAIIGVILAKVIPDTILKLFFILLLIVLSIKLVITKKKICFKQKPGQKLTKKQKNSHQKKHKKNHCKELAFSTGIGGLFLGAVSVGLGEINEYNFLEKLKMHPSFAAATSVFLVALTALAASVVHIIHFAVTDHSIFSQIIPIIIFAVPGVIIGGQLGVKIAEGIKDEHKTRYVVALLFMVLATITLTTMVL